MRSTMDMSEFVPRWRSGVTFGGWCNINSAYGAELVGTIGYDWVAIDRQHGMIDIGDMIAMLQGIAAAGRPAFVRVAANDPVEIMKALDAGAVGVIIPMVNNAEEARAAVRACRHPPLGERSAGPGRAGLGVEGYDTNRANRETLCLVMIETLEAVERADEIAAVEGLDGIFIGPGDLALSGGHQPVLTIEDEHHVARIMRILEACKKAGIMPGIMGGGERMTNRWRRAGFRMIATTTDRGLLMEGGRQVLAAVRADAAAGAAGAKTP